MTRYARSILLARPLWPPRRAPGRGRARRLHALAVLVAGAPAPEYAARGRIYVEALKGRDFVVRLSNPTSERIAVALSVDGRNVIDAKRTSSLEAVKWILGPGQTLDVPGWQVSGATARKFFFTETSKSYAKWLGDTANVGTIEAVFYREKRRRPATVPKDAASTSRSANPPRPTPPEAPTAAAVVRPGGEEDRARRTASPRPASGRRPTFPSSGSPSRRRRPRPPGSPCGTSSARSSSGSGCFPARRTSTPATAPVASSTNTHPIRTGADGARRIRRRIEAQPPLRRQSPLTQPERTDEELLDSAREGDEDAFGAFVRRHTATVHRWMARAVGEGDADDMTQDVFLKAYRGLPRFRGEAPAAGVARLDRRQRREEPLPLAEPLPPHLRRVDRRAARSSIRRRPAPAPRTTRGPASPGGSSRRR